MYSFPNICAPESTIVTIETVVDRKHMRRSQDQAGTPDFEFVSFVKIKVTSSTDLTE